MLAELIAILLPEHTVCNIPQKMKSVRFRRPEDMLHIVVQSLSVVMVGIPCEIAGGSRLGSRTVLRCLASNVRIVMDYDSSAAHQPVLTIHTHPEQTSFIILATFSLCKRTSALPLSLD